MKRFIYLLSILFVVSAFAGCSSNEEENPVIGDNNHNSRKNDSAKEYAEINNQISESLQSFFEEKLFNTSNLMKDRFSIKENTCYRIDSKEELAALYQGTDELPIIDCNTYTLILGSKVYTNPDTDSENYKQILLESDTCYNLNLYSRHLEGEWASCSISLQIYYLGLYPKLADKEIIVNIIYE